MQKIFINAGLLCLLTSMVFSDSMPELIEKNQKLPLPEFPAVEAGRFEELQEAAAAGDVSASKDLYSLVSKHISEVYRPLEKGGGLLFSCRKPLRDFDDPANNYAVNLEEFFEETTDDVRIRKKDFKVHTSDGSEYDVFFPEYDPANASVKVKDSEESRWIPLSELVEEDRLFVENAIMDDLFDSRSFEIFIDDEPLQSKKIATLHTRGEAEAINRTIVLKNEGRFPLENLIIEYQVFAEQIVIGDPDDYPEDYRYVGFFEVKLLSPGDVKRFPLEVPAVVTQQLVDIGNSRWSVKHGLYNESEGRINGTWVRIHRITPYGERLVIEHRSSGTPSKEWAAVAPVRKDV